MKVHYCFLWLLFSLRIADSYGHGKFRETPRNQTVRIGDEVVLRCSLPTSNSAYEQLSQWRANTGRLLGNHEAGVLPGHSGRYSYLKETPEELHLKIDDVQLDDDGKFECQMGRPDVGPVRAAAFVNVLGEDLFGIIGIFKSGL